MRILITGGAGFIGSYLVDYYLKTGDEVIAIDNLITGKEENIKHNLDNKNFRFIKCDVCAPPRIEGNIDLILHFASPASPFDYLRYPIETMKTASIGTINMLEIALQNNAKFLLASTSEVYGDPLIHPQVEEYWGNVNPIGVRSVYDEGKRFAEALTIAYHRKYNLKINIVRIFNTYGERMRPGDGRVIPTFIEQALKNEPITIFGDGKQTRSFCYISDLVEGITRLARTDYPLPLNLGNPREFTILELARKIKELCNSNSEFVFKPLPEDDPHRRNPDINKAKKLLNWEPRIELEQGLKFVIEWFKKRLGLDRN
ncbi:MAG: SDR family oxidoreductase [candidate division WOR-3 bacterium]|nr:SDR family oxidoreductase [candidate division WOR-3 bacterium]